MVSKLRIILSDTSGNLRDTPEFYISIIYMFLLWFMKVLHRKKETEFLREIYKSKPCLIQLRLQSSKLAHKALRLSDYRGYR